MPPNFPDDELDLELTAAEQRALDTLLLSVGRTVERRLPPTLQLTAVGIHVARATTSCVQHAPAVVGEPPEELH